MDPDYWASKQHIINRLWNDMKENIVQGVYKTEIKTKESNNSKEVSIGDEDIVTKLKDLKELLDTGVLSEEDFKKAKKKLLN